MARDSRRDRNGDVDDGALHAELGYALEGVDEALIHALAALRNTEKEIARARLRLRSGIAAQAVLSRGKVQGPS